MADDNKTPYQKGTAAIAGAFGSKGAGKKDKKDKKKGFWASIVDAVSSSTLRDKAKEATGPKVRGSDSKRDSIQKHFRK